MESRQSEDSLLNGRFCNYTFLLEKLKSQCRSNKLSHSKVFLYNTTILAFLIYSLEIRYLGFKRKLNE